MPSCQHCLAQGWGTLYTPSTTLPPVQPTFQEIPGPEAKVGRRMDVSLTFTQYTASQPCKIHALFPCPRARSIIKFQGHIPAIQKVWCRVIQRFARMGIPRLGNDWNGFFLFCNLENIWYYFWAYIGFLYLLLSLEARRWGPFLIPPPSREHKDYIFFSAPVLTINFAPVAGEWRKGGRTLFLLNSEG